MGVFGWNLEKACPLAVSSLKPSAGLPGIPTVAEVGLPGFEFVAWHGTLAPKEFAAYLKGEQEKWGRVIRERNIKAQ